MSMCNRVLNSVQNVSSKSKILTSESWISLLKFLLTVCDNLLGPPTVKGMIMMMMITMMMITETTNDSLFAKAVN